MSNSSGPCELWPARLFCPLNSPGKNTEVGSHSILQGIFLIKGSNLGLPHCRQVLNHPSRQGRPETNYFWANSFRVSYKKKTHRRGMRMETMAVSCWLGIAFDHLNNVWVFPGGSDNKESACNAGDPGSIPGSRRSPGEGNGNPLQYSCLENLMDGGTWQATYHGVAKSRTWLSDFTFTLVM